MEIKFRVHSVTNSTENVTATVEGEKVQATVAALEVELVSDHHGTLVLRFKGSEIAEAKNKFVKDKEISWSV